MTNVITPALRLQLLTTLGTTNAAYTFLDFVDAYKKEMYTREGVSDAWIGTYRDYAWYPLVKTILHTSGAAPQKALDEVAEAVRAASKIIIKLPFEPSEALIRKLYQMFESVAGGCLLEFDVDKNISGGARVFLNGKYLDSTVATRVQSYLNEPNAIDRLL